MSLHQCYLPCKNCPKDFIEQTINPLHIRINKNRRDTNKNTTANPNSAHAMDELTQSKFSVLFFINSIYHERNCNPLKLTNLEIVHRKL